MTLIRLPQEPCTYALRLGESTVKLVTLDDEGDLWLEDGSPVHPNIFGAAKSLHNRSDLKEIAELQRVITALREQLSRAHLKLRLQRSSRTN